MKIAAIMMAYNESIYLPIWCRYYGRMLGVENLFIVDHGSTDGSHQLAPRGVNMIRIPRREAFDETPRTQFINNLQRALLEYYDAVIYGDADELIVPDPDKYAGFQDFFMKSDPVVAPVGLHVFQATDREGAIDLARPILGQRRFCQFMTALCKPVLLKVSTIWSLGFHSSTMPPSFSEHVFLFHLKSIDVQQSLQRLSQTRSMTWSAGNLEHGISHHHRMEDELHLTAFFNNSLDVLKTSADLSFDFSEEVERVRSSVYDDRGYFTLAPHAGKVAEIPQRYFGII